MKKYIFIIAISLFSLKTLCQMPCASSVDLIAMEQQNPIGYANYLSYKNFIQTYQNNQSNTNQRLINNNGIITIPVVVHVLHCGENVGVGRNLSLQRIQSQIAILNKDFRKLNTNTSNIPSDFQPLTADFEIEFKLACINPAGGFTDGIIRKRTNVNTYEVIQGTDGIDEVATGIKVDGSGSSAWPTDRYLNIWVCNLKTTGPNASYAYSQFPWQYSQKPQFDGVVVTKENFGDMTGVVTNDYFYGKQCTHEIGHWLGLFHLWGIGCGDDDVADTPRQKNGNYNCPSFPRNTTCNNTTNGEMYMNFMDYTSDDCRSMFTLGQKDRIRPIFSAGGIRNTIIENNFNIQQPLTVIKCQGKVKLTNNLCLASPQWSVVSGPATILFGQGTDEIILKSTGIGNVTLKAEAGNYTTQRTVQVNLDGPDPIAGVNTSYVMVHCNVVRYKWTIVGGEAATQYKWSYRNVTSGTPFTVFKNGAANWATSPVGDGNCDQIEVKAEAINPCNILTPPSFLFMSDQCPPYTDGSCTYGRTLLASPSPSVTNVQLKLVDEPNLLPANTQPKKIKKVRVVDRMGQIKQTYTGNDLDIMTINLSGLPADIYTILVSDGKVWMSKQVSKN